MREGREGNVRISDSAMFERNQLVSPTVSILPRNSILTTCMRYMHISILHYTTCSVLGTHSLSSQGQVCLDNRNVGEVDLLYQAAYNTVPTVCMSNKENKCLDLINNILW